MKKSHFGAALALVAAGALALAGCSSPSDGDGATTGEGGVSGEITLGYIPSWTDGLSTAYLLKDQLEKLGYSVNLDEVTEPGVLYAGLSNGDVDMYPSAWSEITHADYMAEFGDSIEDIGTYYEGAVLTIAVPTYVDIDSLEELASNADRFSSKIIGIEPGAGLTGVTQDSMMPEYGLDSWELVTSSTAAMLITLEEAIGNQDDIVVTLWRPFWAYNSFDLKDLADPKGAMGEAEGLHFLGKAGFADEFPEAAELISGIKLDDAAYGSLEALVTSPEYDGDTAGAVTAWIADNPTAFPGLITD